MANQTGLDINIVSSLKSAGWYEHPAGEWQHISGNKRTLYSREHVVFNLWADATNHIGLLDQRLLAASNTIRSLQRWSWATFGVTVVLAVVLALTLFFSV